MTMIEIRNGNIEYSIGHLLHDKIETYPEIIDRLDKLETQLFYNIISSPECRYEKKFGERIKSEFKTMSPEERFQNIFKERILYANPKGYFVNKVHDDSAKSLDDILSVSFSLASLEELPEHFKARGSEFGICFFHDFLQNRGLRQVEYLNDNDLSTREKMIFNSPHLVEVYFEGQYDMRWEKEWRINGDLPFSASDIAFVIVPHDKYSFYSDWFFELSNSSDDAFEFPILSSITYKSYLGNLLFLPQMDNSWNQVAVYRNGGDDGYKITPSELPELHQNEINSMYSNYSHELKCLAKNTILNFYEDRYTTKFKNFLDKIRTISLDSTIVEDFKKIKLNSTELSDSERDLVCSLFTNVHQILAENNRLDLEP